MKKIYSIVALAAASLTMVSCSDFLDQKSESEQTTENVYENTYFTNLVLNKAYGLLTTDYTYSQCMSITWNLNSDVEQVDAVSTSGDNTKASSERGVFSYNGTPDSWNKIGSSWTDIYSSIEYCNNVIAGVRGSSLYNNGSKSEKETMGTYLGEAIALRALLYHDALRFWGDIPMKLEPTQPDLSNVYNAKTDRDVIMDTLMVQLKEAIELLPWADQSSHTTEHITKGFAKALYAQMALTRAGYAIREAAKEGYETASYSDATYPTQRPDAETRKKLYEAAAKELAEIITNGTHKLNPSYENEFYLQNQLELDKTYKENLFEVPMLHNVTSEIGYTVGKRIDKTGTDFGYTNSSGKATTTAVLLYSYDKKDLRRDVTCAISKFTVPQAALVSVNDQEKTTDGWCEALLGNQPFAINIGKWRPEWMTEEWHSQNKAAAAKHMTGINFVRMRYSQVLLMYAECVNELYGPEGSYGGAMSAKNALKEVHDRAFEDKEKAWTRFTSQYDLSSKDGFMEALMQENAWEFTGEGVRKWDLIRWGVLAQKIAQAKKDYYEKSVSDGWPTAIYYKYKDESNKYIDPSSIHLYAEPDAEELAEGVWFKETGYGYKDEATRDKDNVIVKVLPYISNGLVGETIDGTIGQPATTTVKNRYIIPIYSTTISDANGYFTNSYGF